MFVSTGLLLIVLSEYFKNSKIILQSRQALTPHVVAVEKSALVSQVWITKYWHTRNLFMNQPSPKFVSSHQDWKKLLIKSTKMATIRGATGASEYHLKLSSLFAEDLRRVRLTTLSDVPRR